MIRTTLISILFSVIPLTTFSFTSTSSTYNRFQKALFMAAPKPSGFANTKAGKAVILERTKKLLDGSALVIAIPAQGISKEQVDILKKGLPESTRASVVKNALMRKAVEGTQFSELAVDLKEQNIFFFITEGEAKPSLDAFKKWQKEVKRTDEIFGPRVAAMEGVGYRGKNVETVCNLPTKKELIAKIAVGIKTVPTKVAKGIKAVPNKLGRAIGAIKNKLEEEAKAATA